ncbi:MAG: RNA-binding protein [Clostridia bacterium]|nr:RNA-binding protein [Clostridia bacterium]
MKRYEPIPGRLVRSLAGRDRGGYFMVVATEGEDMVLIADGRVRPLSRPKRKKRKHLHMTPFVLTEAASRLEKPGGLADGELRRMIEGLKRADG